MAKKCAWCDDSGQILTNMGESIDYCPNCNQFMVLRKKIDQLDGALGKIANMQDSMGKRISDLESRIISGDVIFNNKIAELEASFEGLQDKIDIIRDSHSLRIKQSEDDHYAHLCFAEKVWGKFEVLETELFNVKQKSKNFYLEAKIDSIKDDHKMRIEVSESQIRELNPGLLPIDEVDHKTKCFMCREDERRELEGKKWDEKNKTDNTLFSVDEIGNKKFDFGISKECVEMPMRYDFNSNDNIFISKSFTISRENDDLYVHSCNGEECGSYDVDFTKQQFQQLINDMQQLIDENK